MKKIILILLFAGFLLTGLNAANLQKCNISSINKNAFYYPVILAVTEANACKNNSLNIEHCFYNMQNLKRFEHIFIKTDKGLEILNNLKRCILSNKIKIHLKNNCIIDVYDSDNNKIIYDIGTINGMLLFGKSSSQECPSVNIWVP